MSTEITNPDDAEAGQLLTAIIRAASDPNISPEKMTALYDLHVRMQDRLARLEFNAALARAQARFKPVDRRGKIEVFSKADREKPGGPPSGAQPIQKTPYALYEDVVEEITPHLSAEGLSISFKSRMSPDGRIIIVGYLKHRDGWVEEAETPPLQHDATGSKNAVQAVKSTMSYGRRMAAEMMTNFVSKGDDNDGADGARIESSDLISSEQFVELERDLKAMGDTAIDAFCRYFKIEALADLPASRFKEAQAAISKSKTARAKEAKR